MINDFDFNILEMIIVINVMKGEEEIGTAIGKESVIIAIEIIVDPDQEIVKDVSVA